jgi:peptidoglycan biosynthesis protein MviN/MurJ (putative lipid II flippase)
VSIPFESLNHLYLRAFYATKHTAIPAILGMVNGVAALAIAWLLLPRYGVLSLAVGFTAGQLIELIGLCGLLPRRERALPQ